MKIFAYKAGLLAICLFTIVCFISLGFVNTLTAAAAKTYHEPLQESVAFQPSAPEKDADLLNNPNRGLRLEVFAYENDPDFKAFAGYASQYAKENVQLAEINFRIGDQTDNDVLTPAFYTRLQKVFDTVSSYGMKIMLRIYYQPGDHPNPPPFARVIGHINQIGQSGILEKNKGTLFSHMLGFADSWGEWMKNLPYTEKQMYEITKAALANTPKEIPIQTRKTPPSGKYTDEEKSRLGYYIHDVFGLHGIFAPIIDWRWAVMNQAQEHPANIVEGEMYWGCQLTHAGHDDAGFYEDKDTKMEVKSMNVIGQLVSEHFTDFSVIHSYYGWQAGSEQCNKDWADKFSMAQWKNRFLTQADFQKRNLFVDPTWLGEKRSAFDYIRDHLGYKLQLENYNLSDFTPTAGDDVKINVNLKNWGFSKPFGLHSGFGFINLETGQLVNDVGAGDPASWIPRTNTAPEREGCISSGISSILACGDFKKMKSDKMNTFSVSASLKLPNTPGNYALTFFVRDINGKVVRFANNMDNISGYEILKNNITVN
jgi:hypothetical protein